jgi:hypothetical protein
LPEQEEPVEGLIIGGTEFGVQVITVLKVHPRLPHLHPNRTGFSWKGDFMQKPKFMFPYMNRAVLQTTNWLTQYVNPKYCFKL